MPVAQMVRGQRNEAVHTRRPQEGGEVNLMRTKADRGGRGGSKLCFFADVLCGRFH